MSCAELPPTSVDSPARCGGGAVSPAYLDQQPGTRRRYCPCARAPCRGLPPPLPAQMTRRISDRLARSDFDPLAACDEGLIPQPSASSHARARVTKELAANMLGREQVAQPIRPSPRRDRSSA